MELAYFKMRFISRDTLLPRNRDLLPSRGKTFYTFPQRRTGCEIQRTSYPVGGYMGTVCWRCAADHSLPSNADTKNS
jgi:hypothetical protein